MADNTIETELIPRLKDQGVVSKLGMFYALCCNDPSSRFECFPASNGYNNYFYFLLLQLVLCRVAPRT